MHLHIFGLQLQGCSAVLDRVLKVLRPEVAGRQIGMVHCALAFGALWCHSQRLLILCLCNQAMHWVMYSDTNQEMTSLHKAL